MYRQRIHKYFLAAVAMLLLATQAIAADFCWRGSEGRGVGTIPQGCTGGRNLEVGMCYTPCKQGWDGAVTMCLRQCPGGYVNTGLTCHINKALLLPATVDVCNARTSCPTGYTNAGLLCGLNTPAVPAGYEAMITGPAASGLDLSRQIYDRGIGNAPTLCDTNKEKDAGLCYPTCKPNYSGIGPVCWGQCPAGWVGCGMGCARNSNACATTVFSQVSATGMSAVSIGVLVATAGTSAAATTPANASKIPGLTAALAKMKELYAANKAAIDAAKSAATTAADAGSAGYTGATLMAGILADDVTEVDIARLSAQLAGLLDPTGLIGAGASYAYDTCDKAK